MVERKLFKTKLCVLYQRGHCLRQSCSFAHGDTELRRFSGSFNAAVGLLRITKRRAHDFGGSMDAGDAPKILSHISIVGLETNEVKDLDVVGTAATTIEKGSKYWIRGLLFLPPPPQVPQNAHSQYRGEDENVDVEALEEEMVDVDLV